MHKKNSRESENEPLYICENCADKKNGVWKLGTSVWIFKKHCDSCQKIVPVTKKKNWIFENE